MNVTEKEINTYKALNKIIEKEVIRIFNLLYNKCVHKYESFVMDGKNIIIAYHNFHDEYYEMISYFKFPIKYLNYIDKQIKRARSRGEI